MRFHLWPAVLTSLACGSPPGTEPADPMGPAQGPTAPAREPASPAIVGSPRIRLRHGGGTPRWIEGARLEHVAELLRACDAVDLPTADALYSPGNGPTIIEVVDDRGLRWFEVKRDETLWTAFNADGRRWAGPPARIYRCAGVLDALGVPPEDALPAGPLP